MADSNATAVVWRRLIYMLSPQLDIYESLRTVVQGKRVLEIGFGTGMGVLQYHAFAEYVDAVEIDPAAVSFVRKTLPLRNVRWICDDISNPSRNYRGYDMFVMIEVLEHIANQDRTLQVLRNSLMRNGSGIITVPNSHRYRRRQESLNIREYTAISLRDKLKEVFERVVLLDATLMPDRDLDSRATPLIAGVHRAS